MPRAPDTSGNERTNAGGRDLDRRRTPIRWTGAASWCGPPTRAGSQLVGIQDHPYQRHFLDTWSLIPTLLAETRRISFFTDVANLPLRPPAVMAKAAATLDVLSGGRFELGLGAGGIPDVIADFGGPRRTPGESVEALEEAIDVIRLLWSERALGVVRGQALPARRTRARARAGAPDRDLARRLQAADAPPRRVARPTAGCRRSAC